MRLGGQAEANCSELTGGATATFVFSFTVPTAPKTHALRIFLDADCVINETNETNNQPSLLNYLVKGPDLAITAMTLSPTNAMPGTEATLTVTIMNIGSLTANSFRMDTWYHRSSAPICGDSGSATETISSLDPGASLTFTYNFAFPASAGNYTARVFVDAGCAVKEVLETNNLAAQAYNVALPVLTMTALTIDPLQGLFATLATLTVTVQNIGFQTASLRFKLDSWFNRSSAPACNQPGTFTETLPSLAPAGSAMFAYNFNYPTTFDTLTARAFVDSGCVIAKMSESNNHRTDTYRVTGPDLVSSVTVTPSTGPLGTVATMTVIVRNIGTNTAANIRLDNWFISGTTPVCGNVGSVTETIASLDPGASVTFEYPVAFALPFGNKVARAFVDSNCAILEPNETNNQSAFTYSVIGADLQVAALTITPTSGPPGTAGTMTVVIRNAGLYQAANFNLDGWFDRSAAAVCGNVGSITLEVGSLAAGASTTFDIPFNFPSLFGTRTARAFVDSTCAVTETVETNNQVIRTYTVTGPDLIVSGLTLTPANGFSGAAGTMTVVVRNQGLSAASQFVLGGWLHRIAAPVCGNPASVTRVVEPLAAGASLTIEFPFNFPTAFGNYTAYAFADATCLVSETTETNNVASRGYSVGGSDLQTVSVTITPTMGAHGTAGTMTVVIRNNGA